MGLFIQQNDSRSRLQERIEAELREKAKQQADIKPERPDGVDDAQFVTGYKRTAKHAWIWIVLVAVVVIGVIWLIVSTSNSASTTF